MKLKQPAGIVVLLAVTLYASPQQETSRSTVSNFSFVLKYGVASRNVLDTNAGKFTKDLVVGTAVTDLKLTDAELDRIQERLTQIDFWNDQKFPTVFSVPNTRCTITPRDSMSFAATLGNKVKQLSWHDMTARQNCFDMATLTWPPDYLPAEQLRELVELIRQIVESKAEFQKLPPARSAYF